MRTIPIRPIAALLVLSLPAQLTSSASAQGPRELSRLFPNEAEVSAAQPGIVRLRLDDEVLREARPDLSDVRLFGPDGAEIPWFVDSAVPPVPEVQREQAPPLEVRRSVEERGSRTDVHRETIVVELPAAPPAGGRWALRVEAPQARFVRDVTVTALGDGGWEGPILTRATVFRLPQPLREHLLVPLPPTASRRLAVRFEGDEGFHLEPVLTFESSRGPERPEQLVVRLTELSRERRGTVTRVELARPAGIVPGHLRLATSSATFHRRVRVRDLGPAGERHALGTAVLYRVPGLVDAEELSVLLSPARGERLAVEIEDGDGPPLEGLAFDAVVRQPALVFDMGATAVLRFGGGRAHAPQYDLAGLVGAGLARRLVDTGIPTAHRSGTRSNPGFDPAPALTFVMQPGVEVDPRRFTHRRPLHIGGTPEGLSRVRLTARETAAARADLSDLRVVDAHARQWPYLLERNTADEEVELTLSHGDRQDGFSEYALQLPAHPLPLTALRISLGDAYLDRAYELVAIAEQEEHVISRGRLVRRPDRPDTGGPLVLDCGGVRADGLRLRVEDGDDAPLEITRIAAVVPVADLFVAAPPGDYLLMLGHEEAEAPQYEIARARDLVLAVTATPVSPARLERNPRFTPRTGELPWQELLLWVVLVLAVLVLAVLTFRVARSERDTPEDPGGTPGHEPGRGDETHEPGAEPEAEAEAEAEKPRTESEESGGAAEDDTTDADAA